MATLNVGPGRTYTTIQAAIDAAAAGDLIFIDMGTYAEDLTIDKDVSIGSADAEDAVIAGNVTITTAGVSLDTVDILGTLDLSFSNAPVTVTYSANGEASYASSDFAVSFVTAESVVYGSGTVTSTGSAGDDTITGSATGDNVINAGGGDDTVIAGDGDNTINSGDANANGGDTVTTGNGNNTVTTGNGDDVVTTGDGDDTVVTGDGDDFVHSGNGNDSVITGAGDDTVEAGQGGGDDYFDGGAGTFDTLTYPSTTLGVTIDMREIDRSGDAAVAAILTAEGLATNTAVGKATGDEIGTDAFRNFENSTGGAGNDVIIGNAGINAIDGGAGDDFVTGGLGNDTLIGGDGSDSVSYADDTVSVQVNFTTGQVNAGAGDLDSVTGFENAVLGANDDQFIGDLNDNVVEAGAGNDQLDGRGGIDTADYRGSVAADGIGQQVFTTLQFNAGVNGTDQLTNIERVRFVNEGEILTVLIDNGNAVVASRDDAGAVLELGSTSGNVLANDVNLDQGGADQKIVASVSGGTLGQPLVGAFGTLTLNADGSYTYVANAGTNALSAGEVVTDVFTYTADDGDTGTSTPATLTITITGENDAPTVGGTVTGAVEEDVTLTATGTLTAVDPDDGESAYQPISGAEGAYGVFALETDGDWTYTLDNGSLAVQSLAEGQVVTDSFIALTVDGTSQTVTISVTGDNDAPVITDVTYPGPTLPVVIGQAFTNGSIAAAVSLDGTFGLTNDPNVENSTTIAHAQVLATATGGEVEFFSFTVGARGSTVLIDVDSTPNFDPTIGLYNALGNIIAANDDGGTDPGSEGTSFDSRIQITLAAGTYYIGLDNFPGIGNGGAPNPTGPGNSFTINVSLSNPAFPSVGTGAVTEGNGPLALTGAVIFSDIDTLDTPVASYAGSDGFAYSIDGDAPTEAQLAAAVAAFTVAPDGTYAFNLASPDYLDAGEVLTLIYTVVVTDDFGATDSETVVFTITGTNDVPVITSGPQAATLVETNDPLSATGQVTATDADADAALEYSLGDVTFSGTPLTLAQQALLGGGGGEGNPPEFVVDAATGAWTYNIASPDFLGEGDTVTATFEVEVDDGNGGTVSQNVDITINGTNDAPFADSGTIGRGFSENLDATPQTIDTGEGGATFTFTDVDETDQLAIASEFVSIVYTDAEGAAIDPVASGLYTQAQFDALVAQVTAAFSVTDTNIDNNVVDASWRFNTTFDSLDFLGADEQLTITFNLIATDDSGNGGEGGMGGASATQAVTVEVFGNNDAPVFGQEVFAFELVDTAAYDDLSIVAADAFSADDLVTDLDFTDIQTYTILSGAEGAPVTEFASAFGIFRVAADGTITFEADDEAINALNDGESFVESFFVRTTDRSGASDEAEFSFTFTGGNDNPVVPSPVAFVPVDEANGQTDINLLTVDVAGEPGDPADDAFDPDSLGDVDVDGDSLSISVTSASLTPTEIEAIEAALNANIVDLETFAGETGFYSFDSNLFDSLDLDETATITFTFDVVDDDGNATPRTATLVINGALEVIEATAGDDIITGGNFGDLIDGLDGDDTINGGGGNDSLIGNTGDDALSGGGGDDDIQGGEGDDTIAGGSGADNIDGGEGNDAITGGSGDDTIASGPGTDTVDGGSGTDTLVLAGAFGDYAFTQTGANSFRFVNDNGDIVTASNVELFSFEGGMGGTGTAADLLNDAPVVNDATFAIDEAVGGGEGGPTVVGNVGATDPDLFLGDVLSYAIIAGNGAGNFAIDEDGNITISEPLDFDEDDSYTLTVRVTDARGLSDTAAITINVNDVDQAVGAISVTGALSAPELADGTIVATAAASDGDAEDSVSYSLDDDAGGRFAIDATTGVVTVVSGILLDFEQAASHGIVIRATSTDGSFSTASATIAVTDVTPEVIVGTAADDTVVGGPDGDSFTTDGGSADSVNLGGGTDVVILADAPAAEYRISFTSAEVGNGNANDAGTLANQDGGLAVRFQAEDGAGNLVGPVSRFDDEGIVFIADEGTTFEVRDLVSGVSRGNLFEVAVLGTNAADTLTAVQAARPYYFNAGQGDDSVTGGIANDFLVGGAGSDTLSGAEGNDSFIGGGGNDTITGGIGTDTIAVFNVLTDGADTVDLGGDAVDIFNVSATVPTEVRLSFTSAEVGNGNALDANTLANQDGGLAVRLQAEDGMGNLVGPVTRTDDEGMVFVAGAGVTFEVRDLVSGVSRGNLFEVAVLGTNAADTLTAVQAARPYYFNAGQGDDSVTGGTANDFLVGGAGNDTLSGGDGNDSFIGGGGNDAITGGAGTDTVAVFNVLTDGADAIDLGGDAVDVVNVTATVPTEVRLSFTSAEVGNGNALDGGTLANQDGGLAVRLQAEDGGGELTGPLTRTDDEGMVFVAGAGVTFEVRDLVSGVSRGNLFEVAVLGTNAADTLTAVQNARPYYFNAGQGDDSVTGGIANDFLVGGAGSDTLSGAEGNDSFIGGGGNDTITGGIGTDTIAVFNVLTDGADSVDLGGDAVDIFNVTATTPTQVRLRFTSSEVGNGNALDANTMTNQDGGLAVRLQAEDAAGELTGPLTRTDDEGMVYVAGAGVTFEVQDLVSNVSRGNMFEVVVLGTNAADTLTAVQAARPYYFNAGQGDDTITGGTANDFLVGGAGNDTLSGGDGNDSFIGGGGNDTITGGIGTDTVSVFNVLTDGADTIDLGGDTVDVINVTATVPTQVRLRFTSTEVGNGNALDSNTMANQDGGLAVRLQAEDAAGELVGPLTRTDDEGMIYIAGAGVTFEVQDLVSGVSRGDQFQVAVLGTSADDTLNAVQNTRPYYFNAGGGNDTVNGGIANDFLVGGAGNDTLNGNGGTDTFLGGGGNDVFVVDSADDVVTEAAGGGTGDIVLAFADYALSANSDVEVVAAYGAAVALTGSSVANTLVGSEIANTLSGLGGNDVLQGFGGADILLGGEGQDTLDAGDGDDTLDGGVGVDVLQGGAGNDIYVTDDAGDLVFETVGGGTGDIVLAFADFTLAPDSDVEVIATYGSTVSVTGSSTANTVVGNALGNTLRGLGGDDLLQGFDGDDTLFGGIGADLLDAGSGDDILDGGAGADVLQGGAGNDLFVTDDTGDLVFEAAGEGANDIVIAFADLVLTADAEVEVVAAYGSAANLTGSSTANTLVGNELANVLIGLGGDDLLQGGDGADTLRGGVGNDRLDGGAGGDRYEFDSATGFDTVSNFTSGSDVLAFDDDVFAHTATVNFVQGTGTLTAADGNSTFFYNSESGVLSYDADGNGAGAAIDIANLGAGAIVVQTDLIFY